MAKMGLTETVAGILVIIGGLNWGLVGVANVDIVKVIFGSIPMLQSAVYIIIGLAALYMIYAMYMKQ
ncbi:MAG: DUF378 domain-containing protein [Candidatus Omnitrophica bacterium]|nr:DUF378 domain-containing protein [Candidatus Omnitrophota bacterium]